MSRSVRSHGSASEPITTHILRGTWKQRRFPGSPAFAANCRKLAGAYVVGSRRGASCLRRLATIALFATVEQRTCILEEIGGGERPVVALLLRIAGHHARWVRPVEDFVPQTTRAHDQLTELIHYLIERYKAPRFLEQAWKSRFGRHIDLDAFEWYAHVAGGGSIRTAPRLPEPVSRRGAHALMTAPATLRPRDAFRWAKVASFGVPNALIDHLLYRYTPNTEHGSYWQPFFEKLAAEPKTRIDHLVPILDYVEHRTKQPGGFSFKGQTIATLHGAAERWHAELRARGANEHAAKMGLKDARWAALKGVEAAREVFGEANEVWEIQELLSYEELFEEGRRMHHCVASYTYFCTKGARSIWSLRVHSGGTETSRVTLCVDLASRQITEARRFANALIGSAEYRWLARWARANGLGCEAARILGKAAGALA